MWLCPLPLVETIVNIKIIGSLYPSVLCIEGMGTENIYPHLSMQGTWWIFSFNPRQFSPIFQIRSLRFKVSIYVIQGHRVRNMGLKLNTVAMPQADFQGTLTSSPGNSSGFPPRISLG
jgi:hypothetical protein